jgi:hypothetical protein
MSLLKANSIQIGQSNTATNNFTLSVPSSPDGTIKLARGNSGATTSDVLTVTSGGVISGATINGGTITLGTAINAATGSPTSIDFTSIPSWVKRITVILNEVDTAASGDILVQLGDSGGIESTSYVSTSVRVVAGGGSDGSSSTSGFVWKSVGGINSGMFSITNVSGNIWIQTHTGKSGTTSTIYGGGSKTLSDVLTQVRITLTASDTFSGGSINIMYEG